MTDQQQSNLPISEQYRIVAKKWVDAHAAADMLEESKTAYRSQMLANKPQGMAVNRAEIEVLASLEWKDYITKMVNARKEDNLLRVQLDYLKMKHAEQQSIEATHRAEMKL